MHATFTVFWLNIAIITLHSGERCGPWASGYVIRVIVYCISMHVFALLKNWFLVNKAAENFVFLIYHEHSHHIYINENSNQNNKKPNSLLDL